MENYAYSYTDSVDSSPGSREIDFENPSPSWEEPPPPQSSGSSASSNNLKVKFMVSYGGKIQPRPHDNQLSYVGGETKILAVDRSVKLANLISKLSSLFPDAGGEVALKYQLPGEDLDALISVANDDDLDHLMHEYDRLSRSSKPARLRLFLFSAVQPSHNRGFGSGDAAKSDRERMFVEALNSAAPPPPSAPVAPPPVTNNVDFLFSSGKGIGVGVPAPMHPPPHQVPKLHDPISDPDYGGSYPQIEARIQELSRLQMSAQQPVLYFPKSDDNLVNAASDLNYAQRFPDKIHHQQQPITEPAAYWPPEKNITGSGGFQATIGVEQQPVYVIPYHGPVVRPAAMNGQGQSSGQAGYLPVQRAPPEVHRDMPVYGVVSTVPPPTVPATISSQVPKMAAASGGYGEAVGMQQMRQVMGGGVGVAPPDTGRYAQVAYDSATGRHVYYAAPGVEGGGGAVTTPYQMGATVNNSTAVASVARPAGGLTGEGGRTVAKVPPNV